MVLAAALVPIQAGETKVRTRGFIENIAGTKGAERKRDDDLMLYDAAIARIRKGENYYDFITQEHRKAHYPVRPGLAVRLPTLAYFDAWAGEGGQIVASVLLLAATMLAWWRRLGEEPGGERKRVLAMAFLFVGTSLGLNRYFFTLHELWSGMLLVLSFGLHRPGRKWVASLAAAALAVAIRELALPFILLMAATAFWRRDWKEGSAWSALAAAFLGFLAWHLSIVAAHSLPSDPQGPSWLALRGLSGWLSNISLSSNLRFLPHWLAGPAIILMIFGWAGWKSPAGSFATLLYLGYGLAFMIAGRPDNFYWGVMAAPAMFPGFAFVPQALGSLTRAAFPK
ncbi:MAG: hypothetical protein JF595_05025 [Sphingomonadales bacterium]|nr:hypothetical protein [Sphingomonadales bacterium]